MASRKHIRDALHMITMGAKAAEIIARDEGVEAGGELREARRNAVPIKQAEKAKAMSDKYGHWMKSKGFQGMGLARKIEGGKAHPVTSLKFYVEEKLPKGKCDVLIGDSVEMEIDGKIESIPTDVEPIGKLRLELNRTPIRPALGGCSIFRAGGPSEFGTLGCLVRKTNDPQGSVYILSNSHVLADQGLGSVGDPIIQPGTFHGGETPADTIATLFEWGAFNFVSSGFYSTVDAAIARVTNDSEVLARIKELGLPTGASSVVREGMKVEKYGAASGLSTGIVRDVNFTTGNLRYKRPGGGTANVRFTDQVLCTQFTSPGDSGSAIISPGSGKVVGLHFAGSTAASVFNKIHNVLNLFSVEIVSSPLT